MAGIAQLILNADYPTFFVVPGVPVTNALIQLSRLQPVVACRTEQAAANAAAAYGFQAGTHALASLRPTLASHLPQVDWDGYERLHSIGGPALCITTSGPAFVNALSGVITAAANCWPLVVLSSTVGNQHDSWFQQFQRYPQAKIAQSFECIKNVHYVQDLQALASSLSQARIEAMTGVPGPVLIECEWNLWSATLDDVSGLASTKGHKALDIPRAPLSTGGAFEETLRAARRPLFIFGKGLAFSGGVLVSALLDQRRSVSIPMLMSPMGKGILSEDDERNCGASRSHVMKESDAVFVFGARLNWMFDCSSGWLENKERIFFFNHGQEVGDVIQERYGDKIVNDAADGMMALAHILNVYTSVTDEQRNWFTNVRARCEAAKKKAKPGVTQSEAVCARRWKGGRSFAETFETIHDVFSGKKNESDCPWWLFGSDPTSYVVEGATSMDKSRLYLPINHPKQRMDAATLGAMGLGAPFALGVAMWKYVALRAVGVKNLAAAFQAAKVVLIQGDHAFGFSGMEIETIGRYKLPVKMVVLDNGGMYAMDPTETREESLIGDDPIAKQFAALSVTDLTAHTRFRQVAEAFNFPCALQVDTDHRKDLENALEQACTKAGPALVDIKIDPLDGSKAGFISKLH